MPAPTVHPSAPDISHDSLCLIFEYVLADFLTFSQARLFIQTLNRLKSVSKQWKDVASRQLFNQKLLFLLPEFSVYFQIKALLNENEKSLTTFLTTLDNYFSDTSVPEHLSSLMHLNPPLTQAQSNQNSLQSQSKIVLDSFRDFLLLYLKGVENDATLVKFKQILATQVSTRTEENNSFLETHNEFINSIPSTIPSRISKEIITERQEQKSPEIF